MDQPTTCRPARRAGWLATTAAAAVLVFGSGLTALLPAASVRAQTPQPAPNPAPPTEKPSQKSPAPKTHVSPLNRGRAADDKYWGVTDGNRGFVAGDFKIGVPADGSTRAGREGQQVPFSRIPDQGSGRRLEVDGYQFPRLADRDEARIPVEVDNEDAGTDPVAGTPLGPPGVFVPGASWQNGAVTPAGGLTSGSIAVPPGPSENAIGAAYQRTVAVERPATPIDEIPAATRAAGVVTWYPSLPGAPGELRRYAIRVYLPSVAPSTASPREYRITDARYAVYYHVLVNGTVEVRRRVAFLSQDTEGYQTIVDANGRPLLFPFYSEASYGVVPGLTGAPATRARVELDNTTENELTNTDGIAVGYRYVIADVVAFQGGGVAETIKATPTVTPAHGGRKVTDANPGHTLPAATPTTPLVQPPGRNDAAVPPAVVAEPRRDPTLIPTNPYTVGAPAGTAAHIQDSFAFINNPRQADGDPTDRDDPIYTDPLNPFFQPFEPWNPSTLFRGPAAFIENDAGEPARQVFENPNFIRASIPLSRNYARYSTPFFSHMQVIVARTEYVTDPNDESGLGTVEVGAVYGLDWLTGAPIWRFPDRTYLPLPHDNGTTYRDQYGNVVPGAGLRNPTVGFEPSPVLGGPQTPIPAIPGIGAYDRNGNGVIEDDEVYIVGQGRNPDGGISSGVTIVPRVPVRGQMTVPVHKLAWDYFTDRVNAIAGGTSSNPDLTSIGGVIPAAPGRYSAPGATPADPPQPVEVGMAFVAANNGVIYAIDPYGNNDNDYYEYRATPGGPVDTSQIGYIRPGTTNVFWSFSANVRERRPNETIENYYRYLKGQIPPTEAFAGSSPTVSYYREPGDVLPASVNQPVPLDESEPRLFVGNQNGVLYAMDARADAGVLLMGARPFPYRKGIQPDFVATTPSFVDYRLDLKWWFETEGPIVSTPAVSAYRHFAENPDAPANDPIAIPTPTRIVSKGVYVTTLEGRVYCVDWTGPVLKSTGLVPNHVQTVIWNGTTGTLEDDAVDPYTSEQLNDNFRFHNDNAARVLARPDGSEGTIRPRWAFPQRYRDIDAGPIDENSILAPRKPADNSRVFPNARVAEPTVLAPIYGAPVLMDFPYDPDGPSGPAAPQMRRYVVVAANDPNGNDPEISGKLYLLDQAGDRRDFTTNPTQITNGTSTVVASHPLDRFSPTNYTFGKAAPVWTYRFEYKRLDPATGNEAVANVPQRNSPDDDPTDANGLLAPTRRLLPTVFAGGSAGRLFAVDIDPATGVFLRWRADEAGNRAVAVLPAVLPAGYIPGPEAVADRLTPANPAVAAAGLEDRRILARTLPLKGDTSSVDGGMVVSGGPLQNRNSGVTLDMVPTVPTLPTNDAPILASPLLDLLTLITLPGGAVASVPSFDPTGRLVNQDIDDPIATTVGAFPTLTGTPPVNEPNIEPDTNRAYQYPTLFVTTAGGFLHQVSTNIEGEADDPTTPADDTAALGWALTTDELRFNYRMTLLMSILGPGGPGVGPAVITNAYFAAMDPNYRNPVQKDAADPSSVRFGYAQYPPNEPVDEDPAPDGTMDPRPHFRPRPLSPGTAGNPDPDGDPTTPDGVPATPADAHTGRTGFPLDLSGLFYDKRHAAQPGSPSVNTNDDGIVSLPGYSQVGAALPLADRLDLGGRGVGLADPVPTQALDATNNLVPVNDINPAGTDAIWVFAGGSDGIFYAYTPVLAGRGSGLSGGIDVNIGSGAEEGAPKVDIFPEAYANTLQTAANAGNPVRPDRSQSLLFGPNGSRPFFEWGERVTIVAYDLPYRPGYDANGDGNFTDIAAGDIPPSYPDTVQISVVNRTNGTMVTQRQVRLARIGATNNVAIYPNDTANQGGYTYPIVFPPFTPLDDGNPANNPFANAPYVNPAADAINIDNTPLSLAFMTLELNGGANSTPGGLLEVRISANPYRRIIRQVNGRAATTAQIQGGANDQQIAGNLIPVFTIANPLALQAFVSSTNDGSPANPAPPPGATTVNAIGPFRADDGTVPGTVKANVVQDGAVAGTQDPDRTVSEYSQALTNGNTVTRYIYDPFTRDGGGGITGRNFRYLQRTQSTDGGNDPNYYFPVAAGAAYVSDGTTSSTDLASNRRNLRIVNRSLLNVLPQVRIQVEGDLIWRTWPGQRPNQDPTDNGTGPGGDNPRYTPAIGGTYAMRPDGIINYLPWEQPVLDALPWKANRRAANLAGVMGAAGNPSLDYPDISARPNAPGGDGVIRAIGPGGDLVRGPGSLQAAVSTTGSRQNTTVNADNNGNGIADVLEPLADASLPALREYGVAINIAVPAFQPANLVAMHSLTSTYVQPSAGENPLDNVASGPVQVPRDTSANPRQLVQMAGNTYTNQAVVTPYGYTSQMRVYVDSNNNGVWDANEAYRQFELWMGVPVNIELEQAGDNPIDLKGVAHGFGIQNGLLGYQNVPAPLPQFGFLPPPLPTLAGGANGYEQFFKTFTVVSKSNVNLWNLRASQKISPNTDGSQYNYYAMVSETVDPRFGIMATSADPTGYNAPGLMPQVVTSLDRFFDASWSALTAASPLFNIPVSAGGPTRYQAFYQNLGGRHTLHKPRVGQQGGTVLSIPDIPSTQLPGVGANAALPLVPTPTRIGVAVPLGTPSGVYKSRIGQGGTTLFNAPFQIFEDHDTVTAYRTRPINTGGSSIVLTPAGPMYSGQNLVHPGANPILPALGEGILRPRLIETAPNVTQADSLPASPNIEMQVTVLEAGLTGQAADQALDAGGVLPPSIVTGTLTGIDPFPLFNATSQRPFSSLTPAAFRSVATGNLHVYFSSTQETPGLRGGPSSSSAPMGLFQSNLTWNAVQGTWVANQPGAPVSGATLSGSAARWFSPPAPITVPGAVPSESNRSPFVLYDPLLQSPGTPANAAATLYWVRTLPVGGGEPVNQIYWSPLDPATGAPTGPQALLPPASTDPTVRRYGPRAAFVPNGTALVFWFGGPAGKTTLYYAAQGASGTGAVGGPAVRERALSLPAALSVAQEPSAVVRYMPLGLSQTEPAGGGRTDYVVDVYYTGVSRANQNADIFMSRYRIAGSGANARLIPVDLALQEQEELVAPGRESVYRSRHIGWLRSLNDDPTTPADETTLLPVIYINDRTTPVTTQANWQYDNATQVLFQRFNYNGQQVIVYADTAAGEVRFRGPGAPTPGGNVRVYATYLPLAYRVASGPGADTAALALMDRRPVLSTLNEGVAAGRTVQETILSRPADFDNTNGQGIDRQWIFWQRSSSPGQPQTVYFTTRRVGVDLKALRVVPSDQTIKLSPIDAQRNSTPQIAVTFNGNPIPYEVDVANAKVYVQGVYEGQPLVITGQSTTAVPNAAPNDFTVTTRAQQIDEITAATEGISGRAVPMARTVNEGEAYPVLDLYNQGPSVNVPAGVVARPAAAPGFGFPGQPDLYPVAATDPVLQPGRVWLFWSSSRGRTGQFRDASGQPIQISGYDIYWQTLAPSFQSPSFSGFPNP